MASQVGDTVIAIEEDLLENPEEYDFFQAVRLLSRLKEQQSAGMEDGLASLTIKPELSLDYPEHDITSLEQNDEGDFTLTTTFMGLYGISSPLPAFYTEELLDEEWDDGTVAKDFLDIIHRHTYPLLYEAWQKYRFGHQAVEQFDNRYWDILYSLVGLADSEFRLLTDSPERFLPYLGLLGQRQKSALGLTTILRNVIGTDNVTIEPCVTRFVNIPAPQRMQLGSQHSELGSDTVLGGTIRDRLGQANIQISGITGETFQKFLNDREYTDFLWLTIDFYLVQPFDINFELVLQPGAIQPIGLGNRTWGSLGRDTWLNGEANTVEQSVTIGRNH